MPNLDNFGGPAAWDVYCSEQGAYLADIKARNPGCGTCAQYSPSGYSDDHGMCCCGLAERALRFRLRRVNRFPLPELVEAHGCVPCEYENYQEG